MNMSACLRTGPVTDHIKQSTGGESNVMSHYATTSETTYGKHWSHFEPRVGRHSGAGYASNIRPTLGYSQNEDMILNPRMANIVAKNYKSVTHLHYQPTSRPSGSEPLPLHAYYAGSGFVNELPTQPTYNQVLNTFIDTRNKTAPTALGPKLRPLLQKIQPKDPVGEENGGHGPRFMSTETATRFQGTPWEKINLRKSVGPKEVTGFVENYNLMEPVTFKPSDPHRNSRPGWMTGRPTGSSIYVTHYTPYRHKQGDENLPTIEPYASKRSGFVMGNQAVPDFIEKNPTRVYDSAADIPPVKLAQMKKQDPAEYLNAINPHKNSTVYRDVYQGRQRDPLSEAARLARVHVGPKESTGTISNDDSFVSRPDDPARFITHHSVKFRDPSLEGYQREGHIPGTTFDPMPDGYTKSTSLHQIEPQVETMKMLRIVDPYQARSVMAREFLSTDPSKCIATSVY